MTTAVAEKRRLDAQALDILFREARTFNSWQSRPVDPAILRELYELVKFGPTAANSTPARFVFLTTDKSKARLVPLMNEGNRAKTEQAPVVALVAYDLKFYEKMDKLMPFRDMKTPFAANPAGAERNALQSGTLQGGYFIVAARSLGLDCGPMGGFDADRINEEFFAGTSLKINFVCSLGYGNSGKLLPRLPRLDFEEAVTIL